MKCPRASRCTQNQCAHIIDAVQFIEMCIFLFFLLQLFFCFIFSILFFLCKNDFNGFVCIFVYVCVFFLVVFVVVFELLNSVFFSSVVIALLLLVNFVSDQIYSLFSLPYTIFPTPEIITSTSLQSPFVQFNSKCCVNISAIWEIHLLDWNIDLTLGLNEHWSMMCGIMKRVYLLVSLFICTTNVCVCASLYASLHVIESWSWTKMILSIVVAVVLLIFVLFSCCCCCFCFFLFLFLSFVDFVFVHFTYMCVCVCLVCCVMFCRVVFGREA